MTQAIRLDHIGQSDIDAARARLPRAFGAPWQERAVRAALAIAVVAWLGYLHWLFDFGKIFSGLDRLWVIVGLMVDWSHFASWDHREILKSMLETVAMAFLGTLLASLVALPLGFLGALIDEDALHPAPVALYGLTKRAAETILPRIAHTQGIRFAAARLGSVYGPWEYATGVRDTLSPMLQVVQCALHGEAAVLAPAWRGDYIYSRDVADGLVRLADASSLSRAVYNLGSGQSNSAETWCAQIASRVPGFRWRHATANETANIDSHTGFHRGPMDIGKIAHDTGYTPRFDFANAAADWLSWVDAVETHNTS